MNGGSGNEIFDAGVLTHDEEVLFEQLRVYLARARTAVLSAPLAWSLLAYIQWPQVGLFPMLLWVTMIVVPDAICLYYANRFEKHPPRPDHYRFWRYRQHLLHGLVGLGWGMSIFLLRGQGDPFAEMVILLFLAGVTANSVSVMCAFRTGVALFTSFTLVPVMFFFAVAGDTVHWHLLAGMLVLLGVENLYAHVANRQLRDGIEQMVSNRRLNEALVLTRDSLHHANRELEEKNNALLAMSNRLREQAVHDELTGAYNRRHLFAQLEEEIAVCERHQLPAALIMIDVDHFKQINDRFGHLAGDAVLRGVVDVVQSTLRESDVFGRFGGEEFLVLLRMTQREEAVQLAERLRRVLFGYHFRSLPPGERVTISMGVASFVQGDTVDAWIERADSALYQAKAGGRDCVAVYGQLSLPMDDAHRPTISLHSDEIASSERPPAIRLVGGKACG